MVVLGNANYFELFFELTRKKLSICDKIGGK